MYPNSVTLVGFSSCCSMLWCRNICDRIASVLYSDNKIYVLLKGQDVIFFVRFGGLVYTVYSDSVSVRAVAGIQSEVITVSTQVLYHCVTTYMNNIWFVVV